MQICRLYFSILFSMVCFYANSQTYIGGFLGLDASRFSNKIEQSDDKILSNGFSNYSPVVGVRIDQSVANNLFVRMDASFTKKNVNTDLMGYLPVTNFEFNYWRTRIMLNFSIKQLYFGIGGSYSFKNFTSYTHNGVPTEIPTNLDHSEMGSALSLGYVIGRFDLELYYFISFSPLFNSTAYIDSQPIQSIGLTACYNIKVFNRPGSKSLDCPKF